ncbi:terminase [Selenomonas ruminis]|uniref:Terminase n=1 Tax=Selenomonas ruminis TaxID=2593411 RepID=A0A5D6WD94_9FIRM|nr:terminase [Selenomonas sp. mPRGC5]TYZ24949.1 terminase [Selenomonas sp. mPRGC5]
MPKKQPEINLELVEYLASFTRDPVSWVWAAFPWGEGTLKNMQPQEWQLDILGEIRDGLKTPYEAIREAVASGHGIGKSACVCWIILWAMSTFEDTRGVVTANTDGQLRSKTWAELATWYDRFVAKDMFVYTATSLFSAQPGHERMWRIDAIPWSERNTEAFAGLHNHGKRILVIFDEASAIIDKIWEVTDGAMTDNDTEKIWIAFGNPTRTSGRFFDCFHKSRNMWKTRQIDSRSVVISDKKEIAKWADAWGEDSDFFKVRVKGEFPSASESQFISSAIVEAAAARAVSPLAHNPAPVIIGVDPAWTGNDALEIVMRKGFYYKHLLTEPKNDDDARIAGIIARFEDEYHAAAVFIDQGYGTGIYSMGKVLGREWQLVSFAEKPIDSYYANKRAEMWGDMKKWLQKEGCIEDDQQMKDDLTGPEAYMNHSGKLQLESKDDMKKRGLQSPNKADALALTFAYPVAVITPYENETLCNTEYSPF